MKNPLQKLHIHKNRYGWVPDLPDRRDFIYSAPRGLAKALPPKVDLRAQCSPVEDQGELGSCTANALVGALEFLESKRPGQSFEDLSRLFVYYNERVLEHSEDSDSGAMLRDGIKALAKLGVCRESLWPYAIKRFADKPGPACYADAAKRCIGAYKRLDSFESMKACLAQGFPFVFGFVVYESFESPDVAKTGKMPMPKKGERRLGGHAVLAVGYEDAKKAVLVRNSWGPAWGMAGYFSMPYAAFAMPDMVADAWSVTAEAWA